MSLKKLARLSGVPEARLDQYELVRNQITLEDLLKVACVIDANPLELMET